MQYNVTCKSDFIIEQKNNIWLGSFPLLTESGFINGCSCRLHGDGDVTPNTLNLALHVGDDAAKVVRNRAKFAAALHVDAGRFTTCQQVHGSQVAVVTENLAGKGAYELADTIAGVDALITNVPQTPLLLFYADCVPVLLADKRKKVIGLAHAGWRGTAAAIGAKTVAAMTANYGSDPADIVAAIGPSIGQCCYEVDDYVRDRFAGYEEFFQPLGEGKYKLDLWGVNRRQLLEAGVDAGSIAVASVCTAHNAQLFCSYRAEQGKTGRMGVVLSLL